MFLIKVRYIEMFSNHELLKERVAVVTGASRGIGKAVCEVFAANGAVILACVREINESQKSWLAGLQSKKVKLIFIQLDLTDSLSINSAVKDIQTSGYIPNILVNCAGIAEGALFNMTSLDSMRSLFETNVFAQVAFSQKISRLMMRKSNGGSIINISSSSSNTVDSGTMAYGASKIALERVSKSMALELAPHGIRVNVIAPGFVNSDMGSQMDATARKKLIGMSILKKEGQPLDIANAALFLASDLSSHITAQVIRVDGGIL